MLMWMKRTVSKHYGEKRIRLTDTPRLPQPRSQKNGNLIDFDYWFDDVFEPYEASGLNVKEFQMSTESGPER